MPAPQSKSPAAVLRQLRGQAQRHWQTLGERERLGVQLAGAALALLLGWSLLLAPALRTLKTAPVELERLEADLLRMQAQGAEVKTLRGLPPVAPADAQAALTAATERLGPAARLNITGDRAVVTLSGVPPEALQAWLGEVRAAARARAVEAQLARGPKGYTGSLTLTLGAG
ncbi:MAG: type II secretion system protein M [Roseateles sp.]|nr:MAG: type II secretion system protein M [Roseateles sp.]